MAEMRFVYVTCAGVDEAERLASAVVEERLAACCNALPGMRSVYRWEGEVQIDEEAVLICKTTAEVYPALQARLIELHSYRVPCVVAWPVADGNPDFLEWLEDEARP